MYTATTEEDCASCKAEKEERDERKPESCGERVRHDDEATKSIISKGRYIPGPVSVSASTPSKSPNLCFANANKAISQANATSVRNAARKESREAASVTVVCVEKEHARAKNVNAAAAVRILHGNVLVARSRKLVASHLRAADADEAGRAEAVRAHHPDQFDGNFRFDVIKFARSETRQI